MPASLAIIAALPREVAGLVRGIRPEPRLLPQGIHFYRLPAALVVTAGMGSQRVSLAFEAALAEGPLSWVVSAGLAGACGPELRPGQVLEAHTVIESRTGERFQTSTGAVNSGILVTTDSIAGVLEKARLRDTYGAALVDMEAATVARLTYAHGIGFRAIKGISDAHDYELASLARFAGKRGTFRTGAFAVHTALRPHRWRKAVQLGRKSALALAKLHEELRVVMNELPAE